MEGSRNHDGDTDNYNHDDDNDGDDIVVQVRGKCMEGSNKACRHNRAVSNGKHSAGLKRPFMRKQKMKM